MKVGDLVGFRDHAPRRLVSGVGVITERVPDVDPDYFAWRILLRGEIQAFHESFLKVINESR